MNTARRSHTAILLPNGKVLVAGGFGSGGSSGFQSASEVYDPVTERWTYAGVMITARDYHSTTLLPNGRILMAGGRDQSFGPINKAELYDLGLGFSASWQPQLSSVPAAVNLGGMLNLSGSKLRGISSGSCGNGQDSPGDAPLVQLRSLQSDRMVFMQPISWFSNSSVSAFVSGLPAGHALATVYANGIPSTSSIIRIDPPTILLSGSKLAGGAFRISFTTLPGGAFSALMSSNVALAQSNWANLGGVTEVSPGQYQFTDTQATNQPRRFYRVRSP
jgi:hypothetical protein